MIAQAPRETAKGDDSLERCMVPRDCEATSSRGKPQQVAPGVQTCRSTTRIACVKQGARQPSRPCAGEVGKVRTGTRWEVVGVERWNCKGLGGTGFPPIPRRDVGMRLQRRGVWWETVQLNLAPNG